MSDAAAEPLSENLADSHALLRQLLAERAELAATAEARQREVAAAHAEIARLNHNVEVLTRRQYGPKQERLGPEEQDWLFEDLAENAERAGERLNAAAQPRPHQQARGRAAARNQGALPQHLPRYEVVLEPEDRACSDCGHAQHKIDEEITEQLEVIPAKLQVRRTRRPVYGCRGCEGAPVQAEAPVSPVDGGLLTCGTVAHILTAKYADGLPLYRQCEILAREGVSLDRSTRTRWAGIGAHHLRSLYDVLAGEVMSSAKLFADETPAPTLSPGRGTTKKAYLWAYCRDNRPWNGSDPPAVLYCYAEGRGRHYPAKHLKPFQGTLQVDGYRAYDAVAARRAQGEIVLAHCWAHIRRPIYDVARSGDAPVAEAALRWISDLYAIEADIRGQDAATRRSERQRRSQPLLEAFQAWLHARLGELPPKSPLAKAFKTINTNWKALTTFLEDGRVELDANTLERQIRPVAVGRKAFLFAGNSGGGDTWAMVLSLVQTAKLNGLNPQAYLADVLERIVARRVTTRELPDLLPWNWQPAREGGA